MKIRSPFLIKAGTLAATLALKAVFKTCRIDMQQAVPKVSPFASTDEKFLYCIWHDGIVGVLFSGRQIELAGLTSQSSDGSVVAHTMRWLRIPQVRGSSGKSGAAAIRQISEALQTRHMAITVDGPRGPRRELKDGIVYLASRTGAKVVPVAFDANRAWRPRAKWTDLTIPKPFSNVVIAAGEPIAVPPKLRRDGLEHWRGVIEERTLALSRRVETDLFGEPRGPVEVRRKKAA